MLLPITNNLNSKISEAVFKNKLKKVEEASWEADFSLRLLLATLNNKPGATEGLKLEKQADDLLAASRFINCWRWNTVERFEEELEAFTKAIEDELEELDSINSSPIYSNYLIPLNKWAKLYKELYNLQKSYPIVTQYSINHLVETYFDGEKLTGLVEELLLEINAPDFPLELKTKVVNYLEKYSSKNLVATMDDFLKGDNTRETNYNILKTAFLDDSMAIIFALKLSLLKFISIHRAYDAMLIRIDSLPEIITAFPDIKLSAKAHKVLEDLLSGKGINLPPIEEFHQIEPTPSTNVQLENLTNAPEHQIRRQ